MYVLTLTCTPSLIIVLATLSGQPTLKTPTNNTDNSGNHDDDDDDAAVDSPRLGPSVALSKRPNGKAHTFCYFRRYPFLI